MSNYAKLQHPLILQFFLQVLEKSYSLKKKFTVEKDPRFCFILNILYRTHFPSTM